MNKKWLAGPYLVWMVGFIVIPLLLIVSCRVDGVVIDLAQYVINRKHHEGQEVVNHAQDDGSRGVDEVLVRQVQGS